MIRARLLPAATCLALAILTCAGCSSKDASTSSQNPGSGATAGSTPAGPSLAGGNNPSPAQSSTEMKLLTTVTAPNDMSTQCAVFSPDSSKLYTAGEGKEIVVWDPRAGKQLKTIGPVMSEVSDLAISPDGDKVYAAIMNRKTVEVWNTSTGKKDGEIDLREVLALQVHGIALDKQGKLLAAGFSTLNDGGVGVFELPSGKLKKAITVSKSQVNDIALSPDGTTVVAMASSEVHLVNVDSGKVTPLGKGGLGKHMMAFIQDGKTLIWGSSDNTIKLADVSQAKEIAALPKSKYAPTVISVTADGKFAFSVHQVKEVHLWDLAAKNSLASLKTQVDATYYGAAISPDGKLAAIGGWKGKIELYLISSK